jgi:HPt (histidine-containing phosphotransfer) domain-containing protein
MNTQPQENFYDPLLADLIPGYIDTQRKNLTILSRALLAQDFTTISEIAHRIRGSAGCYGFKAYGETAAALEVAAKKLRSSDCQHLFELMRKEFP